MSYELQVPFENLTLAKGNARTKKTAYLKYNSISPGSETRWGSNWTYVDEDGDGVTEARSTVYDVGKIGINLDGLGLPSFLPSGTKLYIQVTSTAKWCGAGYIKGHVSFDDLSLNQTVKWNSEGGEMLQQSELKSSRIITCSSSYGWTTDVDEYYKGDSPQWEGTFSEGLNLEGKNILYIYMLDTVYNFGNPGSTKFEFNDSTFKVWFILPYTQVGNPSNLVFKIGENNETTAKYDSSIELSWTAAEDGANNPISAYRLWCKPNGAEPFVFDSVNASSTSHSYIGYKVLPSMVKYMDYQIGIQAMATYENLNSEVVYSSDTISIVNSAPPAPTVSTFSRLRINADENGNSILTSVVFDECYSEDPDFFYAPENYRNETLKYYYYLSDSELSFDEGPEIEPEDGKINIVDINGTGHEFLELSIDSYQKATVEMTKEEPWFYVIAQDSDGVYSPITSYYVETNFGAKEPRITLSAATTITSFGNTRIYTDKIEHITFGLGEDERSFSCTFYLIDKNNQEIELGSEEIFVYGGGEAAYLNTGSVEFSQAGYGNEIKIKVKYTDQYEDTFEVISSEKDENNNLQTNQIYYYPKDMNEIAENFLMDVWANQWKEESGVSKTYLESGLNNCQLNLTLSGDDIPVYVNIYRQSSEDSKYELLISDTFQDTVSNEKNFTLTNTFKYLDSNNTTVFYEFYYKLSNDFGQSTDYKQYLTNTYRVLPKFNVSKGNFSFSKKDWHPLRIYVDNVIIDKVNDELVKFTCLYNTADGIGINKYKIEANCNGNAYVLAEGLPGKEIGAEGDPWDGLWLATISGSTIEFIVSNMELFKQFGIDLNSPTLNVTYKLTGYNAYDVEGDSKTYENCIITTQEIPSFGQMTLKPVINSNAIDDYKTWFNPNDKITFSRLQGETLIYPFDYNDYDFDKAGEIGLIKQTIENYKIYFKYPEDESWKEVSQGAFNYNEDCISFSAPDLAQNNTKTVIFGVSLLDDTGLESEIQTISEGQTITELFACREENPSLKISGADVITEGNNQYLSVNLISSDLGGNDGGKENFTRSGAETFSIAIYAATTIDGLTSGRTASVLLSNGDYSESPNNKNLDKNLIARFLLGDNDAELKEAEKLYIKVAITITTNSVTSQVINSTTTTFLLYLNPPTMAHRAHWVGLNTTEKENDEVFKVVAFKDKKIIRLVGPYLVNNATLVTSNGEELFDNNGNLLAEYSESQEGVQEDVVIEIDLTQGTIYSPSYCLNLKTGEFIGNTLIANSLEIPEWGGKYTGNIDGGTW